MTVNPMLDSTLFLLVLAHVRPPTCVCVNFGFGFFFTIYFVLVGTHYELDALSA